MRYPAVTARFWQKEGIFAIRTNVLAIKYDIWHLRACSDTKDRNLTYVFGIWQISEKGPGINMLIGYEGR